MTNEQQRSLFEGDDDETRERLKRLAMGQSGEQLRDEGIARVLSRTKEQWQADLQGVILSFPVGQEVTGEEIRWKAVPRIGEPHHPNVWGGVIKTAIKDKLLEPTGEVRKSVSPKNHAHRTFVYRRITR
jgi:hypothetical protein